MATSSKAPKKNFDDIMAAAQAKGARAESTLSVCLSPNISRRLAEIEYQLTEAREREEDDRDRRDADTASKSRRVGDDEDPTVEELEAERDQLIDDNEDVFYDLQLRAAPFDEWTDLRALHPPKDDVPDDEEMGVCWKTFAPAAVRKCMVDPEPTDKVMTFLNEALTTGEWNRLGFALLSLNNTVRERPKSRRNTSTPTNSDDE